MKFALFLCSFLSFYFFYAQNTPEQNILDVSYEVYEDSIKKYNRVDTTKAISAAKLYIKKAKKEGDLKKEWKGLYYISNIYRYHKYYELSNSVSDSMLSLCKEFGFYDKMVETYLLKSISSEPVKFKRNIGYMYIALNIARKYNYEYLEYKVKRRISNILLIVKDDITSIKLNKEILLFIKNKKDTLKNKKIDVDVHFKGTCNFLVKNYINLKIEDSANYYNNILKSKLFKEGNKDAYFEREFYLNKSEISFIKDDYDLAEEHLNNSLEYANPNDPIGREFQKAYLLGRIAFKEKKYNECINIIESHLEINSCVTDNEGMFTKDCYQYLGQSYKELNNYEKASFYYEMHINSILEFEKLRGKTIDKYKVDESLRFQDEIKQLKQKKKEQKNKVNITVTIAFLVFLSFIIYFFYNRRKNKQKLNKLLITINNNKPIRSNNVKKSFVVKDVSISIKEETIKKIEKGLDKLEQEKYFLKPDCSAPNIAKKLKTNANYVSKVIKQKYHKKFNVYINDLRINYAITRLKEDSKFRSYSIESISKELGYKSADTFTKHFKQATGVLPSKYIKNNNYLP